MTESSPQYSETGRYLGVDAYFHYGEHKNWVYSYCNACWKSEILSLPFVSATVSERHQTAQRLEARNATLTTENASLKAQLDSKSEELESIKAQSLSSQSTLEEIRNELATIRTKL